MHTLLGVSSLFLVVAGGYVGLGFLRRLENEESRWRRDLQLLVLAAPIVSLGIGVVGLHHFVGLTCLVGAPPWDFVAGVTLPIIMGVAALAGVGLSVLRLLLVQRVIVRRGRPAPGLQVMADRLAAKLQVTPPRVLVYEDHRPEALACGFRFPVVMVSSALVGHMDDHEIEAVLAHELGHIVRRDYQIVWLAALLRDAFFYLPTSRAAFRLLQREKEMASDDVAVGLTGRPLALAGALAKIWGYGSPGITLLPLQRLDGEGKGFEDRISRLLRSPILPASNHPSRLPLAVGISGIAGLLAVEGLSVAVILTPMGCGVLPLLLRWF